MAKSARDPRSQVFERVATAADGSPGEAKVGETGAEKAGEFV